MVYGIGQIMLKLVEIISKKELTQKDYDFIKLCEKDTRGAPITRIPISDVIVAVKAHINNDKSILQDEFHKYYYEYFLNFKN